MDPEPSTIVESLYRYEETAPTVAGPAQVGPAEVAFYREHGYLVVDRLFSEAEVATARTAVAELIAAGQPDDGHELLQFERSAVEPEKLAPADRADALRKLWLFVPYDGRLRALSQHGGLHRVLRLLLEDEAVLFQDMALLKPPRIGREKPWHQDAAYFNIEPMDKIVGCWVALDPATAENGCMHVIPGSHRWGPQRHVHERDCQLPDDAVQVERDVLVPLAPGGCLFFAGLTHHGTPPNLSEHRRWALQFHYHAAACQRVDTDLYAFRDEQGYAGC